MVALIVGDGETLSDLPFSEVVEHGCADADMTLRLYHRLENELEKRSLLTQFSRQAMVLLRALAGKECTGVRLNMAAVYRRREVLTEEAATLRSAVIAEAGKEFDIDSLAEITKVLRDISPLCEQIGRRRLTLAQLEELAGTHSLSRLIVKYSRVQKLVRQLEVICREAKEGRVFPIFSQHRSEYGALSSTGPRICEPDGPLEATAVMDEVVRERMEDRGRSIGILQQITEDEVLRETCAVGPSIRALWEATLSCETLTKGICCSRRRLVSQMQRYAGGFSSIGPRSPEFGGRLQQDM